MHSGCGCDVQRPVREGPGPPGDLYRVGVADEQRERRLWAAGRRVDLLPNLRRLSHGEGAAGWNAAAKCVRTERHWRPYGIWQELAPQRGAGGDNLDDGRVGGGCAGEWRGDRNAGWSGGWTELGRLCSAHALWRGRAPPLPTARARGW